jgi:type II secretory pathway component PulK
VLVVVAILALAGWRYSDLMMDEYAAADNAVRETNARLMAESGVNYALALFANQANIDEALAGNWHDNPDAFHGVLVQQNDNLSRQGRFSIVAPADDDSGSYRFGVTDEAGRLNVNALIRLDPSGEVLYNALVKLPGMDETLADRIVDWLDGDTTPRSNGAEDETYGSMSPAYRAKNGPIDTLDELLLVHGMTPELLFGNDRNRNGVLDPGEDDGTGVLDRGLSGYLTVFTREQNIDSEGTTRRNLNMKDLDALYKELEPVLGEELAAFIYLYRLYGPKGGTSSQQGGNSQGGNSQGGNSNQGGTSKSGGTTGSQTTTSKTTTGTGTTKTTTGGNTSGNTSSSPSTGTTSGGTGTTGGTGKSGSAKGTSRQSLGEKGKEGKQNIESIYDLIDAVVEEPPPEDMPDGQPTTYTSPLSSKDSSSLRKLLPLLLDYTTVSEDAEIPGRVNINSAPEEVIAALPELDDNDVSAILSVRPSLDAIGEDFASPAWLLTEAKLDLEKVKKLEKYVTTQSKVFRLQSVGYFDEGSQAVRLEVVIDVNMPDRPRVVYRRDLSELGKGFDLANAP